MVSLGIGAAAVTANPNVALIIDGDPVVRIRPIVTRARAAPVPDEVAFFVELKNGRSRNATLRSRRLRRGVNFHGLVGVRPMHDPDMILAVHGYTDGHAQDPMVRKRLRPQGVHFKLRHVDTCGGDSCPLFEDGRKDPKPRKKSEKGRDYMKFALHRFPPRSGAAGARLLRTRPDLRSLSPLTERIASLGSKTRCILHHLPFARG